MKVFFVYAMAGLTVFDLALFGGEHVAGVLHWIGGYLEGIRSAGTLWGA